VRRQPLADEVLERALLQRLASDDVSARHGQPVLRGTDDCALDDVSVSMPVTMSFRRHAFDKQRGFTGYFWKAVPVLANGEPDATETGGA